MKTANDWLRELAKAGFGHPAACCCDRCKKGYETFLLESDIAEIQNDAIASTQKVVAKLIDGCLSPVTDSPQEEAFYKRVDP